MAASPAASHVSAMVAKPIQAVTFSRENSHSRPQSSRGTARLSRRARAMAPTSAAAMKPA